MLPSFRLILATFLCGFAVVFAGLRMAVRFNDSQEAPPVMAGHAPAQMMPTAERRGLSLVPAMYDMRFAIGAAPAVLVRVAPSVLERPLLPLSIAPPEDEAVRDAVPAISPAPVPDWQATPLPEAPSRGDPQP